MSKLALLTLSFWVGLAQAQQAAVQSVIPALPGGSFCTSSVELRNLSGGQTMVDLQAHKPGGALVPLYGKGNNILLGGSTVLAGGALARYELRTDGEGGGGWIAARELLAEAGASAVVVVMGKVECVEGDHLVTARREVAYPMKNPWFEGETAPLQGATIVMVNASAVGARADVCYSSGNWYSVPGRDDRRVQQRPICQEGQSVLVPPFGSREFPVTWEGSTQFSLRTRGNAVVLQLMRPVAASVRVYRVDSTIQFGSEADDRQ